MVISDKVIVGRATAKNQNLGRCFMLVEIFTVVEINDSVITPLASFTNKEMAMEYRVKL